MSTKKRKNSKQKERRNVCNFCNPEPANIILYLIGTLIMIYSLWFHKLQWFLVGLIPLLIGHYYQYKNGKNN